MRAFVRIGKRRAIGLGESFEEFARLEFRQKDGSMDLRPSVYQTDGGQPELVKAYAEHAASFLSKPLRSGAHFDVSGLAEHRLAGTVGTTRFLFTRLRHHEVVFDSLTLAMEFFLALHSSLPERTRSTSLDEVRDYVRGRLAAHDREWGAFRADPDTSKEWRRVCGDPGVDQG